MGRWCNETRTGRSRPGRLKIRGIWHRGGPPVCKTGAEKHGRFEPYIPHHEYRPGTGNRIRRQDDPSLQRKVTSPTLFDISTDGWSLANTKPSRGISAIMAVQRKLDERVLFGYTQAVRGPAVNRRHAQASQVRSLLPEPSSLKSVFCSLVAQR